LRLSQGQAAMSGGSQAEASVQNVAAAERMIQALRSRVYELEHSTSWRITAPVRAVRRWLTGRG